MKLNYAILCYKNLPDDEMLVKHVCAYENLPDDEDAASLQAELAVDPEFGMIGDTDYEIIVLERAKMPDMFDYLKIPKSLP